MSAVEARERQLGASDVPTLMTGAMVRAYLAGRKGQTRRVVTARNSEVLGYRVSERHPMWAGLDFSQAEALDWSIWGPDMHLSVPWWHPEQPKAEDEKCWYRVRPRLRAGDRLWVKETHYVRAKGARVRYRADDKVRLEDGSFSPSVANEPKWKPSIFMRRGDSRISLEVVKVRVERVQEISEADAIAEGIEGRFHPDQSDLWTWRDYAVEDRFAYGSMFGPRESFRTLWDSINAKRDGGRYTWDKNPWVWVIEFPRCGGTEGGAAV